MTGTSAATADGVEGALHERLASLSLEQKARLLTGADFWALHAEPAVGLRRMVTSDGPAGVRGERWDERDPSTNVPSPTALAATWDEERIERLGRLLAAEARRKGVDVLLAPTVNLHRTPYGGRHFECFSEDALLTARIGTAYVRGVQSGGVAATVKHFVANDTETERFTYDARIDERTLREMYLLPFEQITGEGAAWAVMGAYNSVNGATMTESPMLRDILKDEWGYDGLVMTDWYAGRTTEGAGNAAVDLLMPGPTGPWGDALVEAVRAGRVSEEALDDKVLRVLRLAARVGALDGIPPGAPPPDEWSPDEVAAEVRGAAAAGFVLARNEDRVLPLDRSQLRRVAVLGPNAAAARTLGGGSATVFPPYTVSPLDGLRAALGDGVRVDHSRGVRVTDRLPPAPVGFLRQPDSDEPGVEVRFLAADGTVLGSERRATGAYTWPGTYLPGLSVRAADAVEVRTRLRVADDGTYLVGASGLGPFRLTVDGEVRLDERIELPPGADPVEGMMRPPQRSVPLDLRAGQEINLVLHHRPEIGGAFGDAEGATVTFQLNVGEPHAEEELDRAVALAADADVAVVVVGTTEEVESEGFDRESLALPGEQDELVRRVAAANPRTVVVVNSGAPVLLPWAGEVPAVVLAWFPGQEFGNALADVLFGDVEPGGRLPTTWPADTEGLPSTRPVNGTLPYDEGLFVGYRGFDRDGREPLFRFGHGLGYTTWDYLGASAEEQPDGDVTVGVRLRNTGSRAGREVVQVYLGRADSAVERPERWLAGFTAVDAPAGAEQTVDVRIPARAFAHWDEARQDWTTEPGAFQIYVGPSSGNLPLCTDVEIG